MTLVAAGVYADLLPWAIAIALTPIAVTAVVVFLGSEHGLPKSFALLAGDAGAMALIAALAVSLTDGGGFAEDGTPAHEILVAQLIAGLVLVAISAWGIRRRLKERREGGEPASQEEPGWLKAVDRIGVPLAFGIGVGNMTINVGNLVFTLSGAAVITNADLSSTDEVLAIAFFVLVATSTVWGPIAIFLGMPERAPVLLRRIKGWIAANGVLVLDGIFLLIGLNLIAASIAGLV